MYRGPKICPTMPEVRGTVASHRIPMEHANSKALTTDGGVSTKNRNRHGPPEIDETQYILFGHAITQMPGE